MTSDKEKCFIPLVTVMSMGEKKYWLYQVNISNLTQTAN